MDGDPRLRHTTYTPRNVGRETSTAVRKETACTMDVYNIAGDSYVTHVSIPEPTDGVSAYPPHVLATCGLTGSGPPKYFNLHWGWSPCAGSPTWKQIPTRPQYLPLSLTDRLEHPYYPLTTLEHPSERLPHWHNVNESLIGASSPTEFDRVCDTSAQSRPDQPPSARRPRRGTQLCRHAGTTPDSYIPAKPLRRGESLEVSIASRSHG